MFKFAMLLEADKMADLDMPIGKTTDYKFDIMEENMSQKKTLC